MSEGNRILPNTMPSGMIVAIGHKTHVIHLLKNKVEFDFCNSPLSYEEENPKFWKFSSKSPPVHDDVAMMKCRVLFFVKW